KSIVSGTAPLKERLVTQAAISGASDAAAVRTFLRMWSLLQYGAWDQVEQNFQPSLRATIGPTLLAAALENDVIVWQATRPQIVAANVSNGRATISFFARDEQDNVKPASISFIGREGKWRVSYFSLLNVALQRAAELHAQA